MQTCSLTVRRPSITPIRRRQGSGLGDPTRTSHSRPDIPVLFGSSSQRPLLFSGLLSSQSLFKVVEVSGRNLVGFVELPRHLIRCRTPAILRMKYGPILRKVLGVTPALSLSIVFGWCRVTFVVQKKTKTLIEEQQNTNRGTK